MVRLPLVTEHSEEMPVVQSTYFDSLRSATRSVSFLLFKFQFAAPLALPMGELANIKDF